MLLTSTVYALPEAKPTYSVLDKSKNKAQLRKAVTCSPEGGCVISFQILNKNAHVLKTFEVSNTLFNASSSADAHAEKILEATCRSELLSMQKELKKMKFLKAKVHVEACSAERAKTVDVE